jgi:hypothetical protein
MLARRARPSAPRGRPAGEATPRTGGDVKITAIESLHADGGGRVFDFLKISTDEGLVGWSEYR